MGENISDLSKKESLDLYEIMVRIRKFEEKAIEKYEAGLIPGFLHPCIGQEAVSAGVAYNLKREDHLVSNHRGHGHSVAKGVPMKKLMAELYGKKSGCWGGRGGSMHLGDLEYGVLPSSAIVGSGIPIAAGLGFASKYRNSDCLTACLFGDGASNTGPFHEGINLAAAWNLPVVYICENNLYAISTHYKRSTSVEDIARRAESYGIPGRVVDGMDVVSVYRETGKALERARKGEGPTLIECKTYRFCGSHAGEPQDYKPEGEIEEWRENDPILNLEKELVDEGYLDEEGKREIEERVDNELEKAVEYAEKGPFPDPESVENGVFT